MAFDTVLDLAPLLARARDAHVPGHAAASAASQPPTATPQEQQPQQQLAGQQAPQALEASAANGAVGEGPGKAAASVAGPHGGANGEGPLQQNGFGQSASGAGDTCPGQQHQRSALAAAVQAAAAAAAGQQGQAAVPPCEYELVGVVEHSGQLRFGHYVSTVRRHAHTFMGDAAFY